MCILLVICDRVSLARTADRVLIEQFLESAYVLPYDPSVEMSDVIFVNANLHDQSKIKALAEQVVHLYESVTTVDNMANVLQEIFEEPEITKGSNVVILRERSTDGYNRLDRIFNLSLFKRYEWEEGEFTNKHSFTVADISVPVNENNEWLNYKIQENVQGVSVTASKKPQRACGRYYIDLYGLPDIISLNIFFQTANKGAAKNVVESNKLTMANNSPLTIDKSRLQEAMRHWAIKPAKNGLPGVKQLSWLNANGEDKDMVCVLFNEAHPERKLLAYERDPQTGAIEELCAWDYSKKGEVVRFLKVTQEPTQKLHANLQNIIYCAKTQSIDWSIFKIDVTKYQEVWDNRSEPRTAVIHGKVYAFSGDESPGILVTNADAKTFLLERFGTQVKVGTEGEYATNPPPQEHEIPERPIQKISEMSTRVFVVSVIVLALVVVCVIVIILKKPKP